MGYQPTIPVYMQNAPTGQYMANANQTGITQQQEKPQLPSYNNLPSQPDPTN